MTNLFLLFMIYGFLGWIVEVIYVRIGSGHWYNRGFLHMPFLPIYAFGAITITIFLQDLPNPILVYIFGVILTSILEYFTSLVMEKLFHTKWWDYSTYRFNLHGRVCLKNSLLFGILSLVVIYGFNPLLYIPIDNLDEQFKLTLINVFIPIFIIDLAYTLRNVSALPIRDIQIISGKVKAYKAGKQRDFEELLADLEALKANDGSLKQELKNYSDKLANHKQIHLYLVITFASIIIFALIIHSLIVSQLIGLAVVLIIFAVFYNIRHTSKK